MGVVVVCEFGLGEDACVCDQEFVWGAFVRPTLHAAVRLIRVIHKTRFIPKKRGVDVGRGAELVRCRPGLEREVIEWSVGEVVSESGRHFLFVHDLADVLEKKGVRGNVLFREES